MTRPESDGSPACDVMSSNERSSGIAAIEAFDQMLLAAVTAVDTLNAIGEQLTPADRPAAALVDQLKAAIAAEALSAMERWPS